MNNNLALYVVEGYGGEEFSAVIHVVADCLESAETEGRRQLDEESHPFLDVQLIHIVGNHQIIVKPL